MSQDYTCDFRCGHNYFPTECPHPRCGYRELMLECNTKHGDLDTMMREIERLKKNASNVSGELREAIRGAIATLHGNTDGLDVSEQLAALRMAVSALEDAAK